MGQLQVVTGGHVRDANGLTFTQRHCLQVIARLRVELGRCPRMREVAYQLGHATVGEHLAALVRKLTDAGCVTIPTGTNGTLLPTDRGWRISGVAPPASVADLRVERPFVCFRCGARTFTPHTLGTCMRLIGDSP